MKDRLRRAAADERGGGRDVGDGPRLVVDVHERDERRIGRQVRGQLGKRRGARFVRADVHGLIAALFEQADSSYTDGCSDAEVMMRPRPRMARSAPRMAMLFDSVPPEV